MTIHKWVYTDITDVFPINIANIIMFWVMIRGDKVTRTLFFWIIISFVKIWRGHCFSYIFIGGNTSIHIFVKPWKVVKALTLKYRNNGLFKIHNDADAVIWAPSGQFELCVLWLLKIMYMHEFEQEMIEGHKANYVFTKRNMMQMYQIHLN